MPTIRSRIISEIVTLVETSRPIGVPSPRRLRTSPVDDGQFPSLIFYPGDENIESIHNDESPSKQRTLTLYAEVRVSGDEPDELADPILDWLTKRLGSTRLPTTEYPKGLVLGIQETRIQWRIAQATKQYFVALVSFDIRYKTKRNDQSAQS